MLVMTRKFGEAIRIGDGIIVRLERRGASAVRIHIEAPRSVRIRRGELAGNPSLRPLTEVLDLLPVWPLKFGGWIA